MTITADLAMEYMEALSDSLLSVEELAVVFMRCARYDVNPVATRTHSPVSELVGVLSPQLMPTAHEFAAVYLATGTTEADRVGRWGVVPSYRPTATTESAWCRATLKRAAMREQVAA